MDAISVISAFAAVVSTSAGIWYARRADGRANRSDARAAEDHKIAKEAHSMARVRYAQELRELRKQEIASQLVAEAHERAAADPSGRITGILLSPDASELHREAAMSLKGDLRVQDVTVEADGTPRIWVNGSGFPKMP